MSYFIEYWYSFITTLTVTKCLTLCKERCPVCSNNMASPVLHEHLQLSMLEKIERHLFEARGVMSSKFDEIIAQFMNTLEQNFDEEERSEFITMGRSFLLSNTPQSLYFGRFVTEETDRYLNGRQPQPKGKEKAPPKKKPSESLTPKNQKRSKSPLPKTPTAKRQKKSSEIISYNPKSPDVTNLLHYGLDSESNEPF